MLLRDASAPPRASPRCVSSAFALSCVGRRWPRLRQQRARSRRVPTSAAHHPSGAALSCLPEKVMAATPLRSHRESGHPKGWQDRSRCPETGTSEPIALINRRVSDLAGARDEAPIARRHGFAVMSPQRRSHKLDAAPLFDELRLTDVRQDRTQAPPCLPPLSRARILLGRIRRPVGFRGDQSMPLDDRGMHLVSALQKARTDRTPSHHRRRLRAHPASPRSLPTPCPA